MRVCGVVALSVLGGAAAGLTLLWLVLSLVDGQSLDGLI